MQHAVAGDVRTDHLRDTFLIISLDKGNQLHVGCLLPATDRDLPVFRVRPQQDALAPELVDPGAERLRLPHGDTPARYHLGAALEGDLHVRLPFQAAPEIDDQGRARGDPVQRPIIDDTPLAGPVQVHHVQTADAIVLQHLRHLQRILVVHLPRRVIALRQPHAFTLYYIYRGNQFYHSRKKFSNILSPIEPLFSGWNWVA